MKETIYYFCTSCGHVHLRNSEIGKLHIEFSYKIQKQKKEMGEAEKGIANLGDVKLKKPRFRPSAKKAKKTRRK